MAGLLQSFAAAQAEKAPVASAERHDQEVRAREIGRALRCVVCQNQSIEESDASLARDMRRLVRARVAAGETNEEVMAFMQDRYGDFVLLKPPVQKNTYFLWFTPFLVAGFGLIWFALQRRRKFRRNTLETVPLTEEERRKLDQLGF